MTKKQKRMATAALALAIERAGGVTALATRLGITKGAVSRWHICPIDRLLEVEHATGVSRTELRPDMFEGME